MIAYLKDLDFWKYQLKDIFLLILISIPFSYLTCPNCWEDRYLIKITIAVNAILWVFLAKGNGFISYTIGQYVSWLKEPIKRLIYSLIGHTLYTVLFVVLIKWAFKQFMDIEIGSYAVLILISLGLSLLITLIMHSRTFLLSWRELSLESERIKKEAISAKYEALKNQVNPHFLFNSLNALTNLVYEDADQSAKFIKKLSEVYRYVLETRDKELVTIEKELNFVQSYIFLQKIRHEESLIFEMEELNNEPYKVVPLAVQMLVENAFKHNVISDEEPLTIKIYKEGESLIIENTLQKKNILKEEESGVGLENIRARYELLSDDQMIIDEEDHTFKVILPLIK